MSFDNEIICKSKHIPIVVICYNNLTFVKNFVSQLLRFPNPIIIMDNCSTYPPMKIYYDNIQQEIGDRITIHRFNTNYGHNVYKIRGDLLPNQFIISDPDLLLHPDMPINMSDILLALSEAYGASKVGTALDLSDRDKFVDCPNYHNQNNIYQHEIQFWSYRIQYPKLELYRAAIDTTFCLVNRDKAGFPIRIAGNFTAKHLPWYKDYIKNNVPIEEIEYWKQNNISSSILFTCLCL